MYSGLSSHHPLFLSILICFNTGASNNNAKSFFGFSVYVSNTTDKLNGSLCFKGDNFTLDTIPEVIKTICPVFGQYVIYYNERIFGVTYPGNSEYAENNVCEVEVYGKCSQVL